MKRKSPFRLVFLLLILIPFIISHFSASAESLPIGLPPGEGDPEIEVITPYLATVQFTLPDGTEIVGSRINGPPDPPPGSEEGRLASIKPLPSRGIISSFPSYDWVFGCSAVSGAMIAGYYDNNSYTNMYTGPTNGGVMPLTDTSWSTWYSPIADPYDPYPNNPLIASHNGVDGRTTNGSIDDYWWAYGSSTADPFIGNWTEHTWGSAIGDYMKTSQSSYYSTDGSTWFYNYYSNAKLSCSAMESSSDPSKGGMLLSALDGTYGRKLFYEARGYTVNDCFNQMTDNKYTGGFSLADFQAEIDAGHPVLLNLEGHSIVGYGYSGSTIYIRDTWDNDPNNTYTMTWGGSYPPPPKTPMDLYSVSVVRLAPLASPPAAPTGVSASDGTYSTKVEVSWSASSGATYYKVFRNTSNTHSGETVLTTSATSSPYDDTSATPGTTYYYWAQACNSAGCSGYSSHDTGYRAVTITPPAPPTGVSASDDTYTTKVEVSWSAASGATYYKVFRNISNTHAGETALTPSHPTSPYDDTSAAPGTTYWYWIQACNTAGCSTYSSYDTGSRAAASSDHYLYLPLITGGTGTYSDPILNGGFESGQDGSWTEYSTHGWDIIMNEGISPVTAHSGSWLAWLGGDYSDTSYVSQSVTIPAGMPYLHYWYWIASDDICGYDTFSLKVDTTTVHTEDLCETNDTLGWVEGVVNLSAYSNAAHVIKFEVTTDGSFNSNFFLDDIFFSGTASISSDVILPEGADLESADQTHTME